MGMDFAQLSNIQAVFLFLGQPSQATLQPLHVAKAHCGHFREDFKPLICSLLMHRFS
jgi:hypothetical protein